MRQGPAVLSTSGENHEPAAYELSLMMDRTPHVSAGCTYVKFADARCRTGQKESPPLALTMPFGHLCHQARKVKQRALDLPEKLSFCCSFSIWEHPEERHKARYEHRSISSSISSAARASTAGLQTP